MDENISSSGENRTDKNTEKKSPALPEISVTSAKKTDPLTPSLLALAEKKKRTIDTEFGTIIIDSDGIKINTKEGAMNPTERPRDPDSRKIDCPQSSVVQTGSTHQGCSRMILFNPAKTATRVLESVTERQVREERGVWGSDGELLAIACSLLVSATTFLYMPHLSLKTSGSAFLLMYTSCHLLFGAPLLLLEAVLGQYSAHGLARLMPEMAPVLRGYSYAVPLSLAFIVVTYMPIVSSTALYSMEATQRRPAWTSCNGSHNSPLCYTQALDRECRERDSVLFIGSRCLGVEELCDPSIDGTGHWNLSSACVVQLNYSVIFNFTQLNELRTVAGEEFFKKVPYAAIPWLKNAQAAVTLSLLLCWTLVALISQGGPTGVRYTLLFVFVAPLIIVMALTITLMRSRQAAQSAWSLLALDTHNLADPSSWLNAAKYAICSHGAGLGVNTFIYSRNFLTHKCQRSVLMLVMIKLAICTLCIVCYAFLVGAHAGTVGGNVTEINAIYGKHHSLVRLTSSLSTLPSSGKWSLLMLVAIVLAGLGSVQIIILAIEASLRELNLVSGLSTRVVTILLCAVFFVIDTVTTIPSSYFTRLSIYQHTGVYLSIVMSFVLVVAVNITLGVEQLLEDVRKVMVVGMNWSKNYWRFAWCLACPLLLLVLFFGSIVEQVMWPLKPLPGEAPGWTMTLSGVLAVAPLVILIGYTVTEYRRSERIAGETDLFVPTTRWRPGLLDEKMIRVRLSQEEVVTKSSHALMAPISSLMTHLYSPVAKWSFDPAATLIEERDDDVTVHHAPKSNFVNL